MTMSDFEYMFAADAIGGEIPGAVPGVIRFVDRETKKRIVAT